MSSNNGFKARVKGTTEDKRERDYKILELLALQPELEQQEVIAILNLDCTQQLISHVVRENMDLYLNMIMKLNPLTLEEGRALELIKHYRRKNKSNNITKKDELDILEQLRREVKGDKPLIDQSKHYTKVEINAEEFRKKSTKEKIDLILGRV